MKATLRPEDAADFKFQGEFDRPVQEQGLSQSQVRRATIQTGSVVELPRLRHRVAIARDKRPVCVGLRAHRVRDQRGDSNKTVGWPLGSKNPCS